MVNVFGGIFYFLLALGILVSIHELGHFLAARACGVKVLRFSIGFGPILAKRTGKDGCEYAISAIPLGGYVKMEGEDATRDEKASLSKTAFKAQSVAKRAIIVAAGPFFNIALSVILFTIVNMSGITYSLPVVGDVIPGSKAELSGFKPFDKIESVNGKNTESWSDVMISFVENIGSSGKFDIVVRSDLGKGDKRTLSMSLEDSVLMRNDSPLEKNGLRPCFGKALNVVDKVIEGSPAQRASIKSGDIILSVNGIKTDNWYRVSDTIANSSFDEMTFVVKRDSKIYQTILIPEKKLIKGTDKYRPFVGISAKVEKIEGLTKKVYYGLVDGFVKAIGDSVSMARVIIVSAGKLITGSISADNVSGPIAIAKGAQESASFGLIMFLSFLGAISVNLGILNLLPVPVLDGGHLVFLAYEAIFKKEPGPRIQMMLTSIGALLLLLLTVFALFNDIKGF